jgi:monovalent cation:H+ antiporter-2, CPA2 family
LPHETPLIATIVAGICLAFAMGLIAQRLRLPLIAGYLMAGVIIGPFTPGFVADQRIADQLAELGVVLLMFGVGLHFSVRDLMSVAKLAVPGAIGQIAVATLLGMSVGWALGWGLGAGLIFGLSLSVASTVVLLRALQDRNLVKTDEGKVAVGWLIVEDLVMVLALVLIPALSGVLGGTVVPLEDEAREVARWGIGPVAATLLVTLAKVGGFVALMLVVGRRFIPSILHYVAHTGSRELFRLSVLSVALGVAFGSAAFFGVSFALGAFFAGMVMAESTLSTQAMKETLPLRDAFAVLFFVSVGMLFNPTVIIEAPLALVATVAIILLAKSLAAFGLMRAFGQDRGMALTIAASLAQIGEFSFILIVMGVNLAIVPAEARDLVVAGALISILVNPVLFWAVARVEKTTAVDRVTSPTA